MQSANYLAELFAATVDVESCLKWIEDLLASYWYSGDRGVPSGSSRVGT